MYKVTVCLSGVDENKALSSYLSGREFEVHTDDIETCLSTVRARTLQTDFILLQIKNFSRDCLELLECVKQNLNIPVLILAEELDDVDRILALEMGVNGYLDIDVSNRLVLARIHAMLRRSRLQQLDGEPICQTQGDPLPAGDSLVMAFDDWTIDMVSRELKSATGEEVRVTNAEFNLLNAFLERRNRILTRDVLLQACYDDPSAVYDRNIDYLVLQLRKKIEVDPKNPRLIKTEHGVGYVFTANVRQIKGP